MRLKILRALNIHQFQFVLNRLPTSEHYVTSIDSQPVSDCAVAGQMTVAVQVAGSVRYTGHGHKMPFQQTFLITEQGRYSIQTKAYPKESEEFNRSLSRQFVVPSASVYQATQLRHLAFQLFNEHTNKHTNQRELDLLIPSWHEGVLLGLGNVLKVR